VSPYLHVLILIFMNYHRFFSLILLSPPSTSCLSFVSSPQHIPIFTELLLRQPPQRAAAWPGSDIGVAAWPGRDRERWRGSSFKTATTMAWARAPPRRCDLGVTESGGEGPPPEQRWWWRVRGLLQGHPPRRREHGRVQEVLLQGVVISTCSDTDGSSSLSAWPMAASFLDAWIWAWRARESGLRIFLFLKIDFECRFTTTGTKKKLFFVSKKWYRLVQPIPITFYQPIRKTIFVIV
jgi:hypothetical protein